MNLSDQIGQTLANQRVATTLLPTMPQTMAPPPHLIQLLKRKRLQSKTNLICLLVYYATITNHHAKVTDGGVFVNSVCEVLNEAYKSLPNNLSLSQMVTKINEKIRNEGIEKVFSSSRSTLTKEVYFTPKYVSFIRNIRKLAPLIY
jgi:hypothetical protein